MDKIRRKTLKAAIYIAPAILSLKAYPSFARSGSGRMGVDKLQSRLGRYQEFMERHDR